MYDSRPDTQKHIYQVIEEGVRFTSFLRRISSNFPTPVLDMINRFSIAFQHQIANHDASKLVSPEKDGFDKYTPMLAKMEYGSDEYKKCLEELQHPYLDHHYANNSHHPEHYKNGINGMNLFDLVEMYCDWKAAVKRNKNGDIQKSIDINEKRFKIDKFLAEMFRNTANNSDELPTLWTLVRIFCGSKEDESYKLTPQIKQILSNTKSCEQMDIFKNTVKKNCSVTAMAFEKKVAKKKIEDQSNNLISWWCLLDYFKRFEDINSLTPHEQGKLAGLLKSLSEIDFKKTDSIKARRKVLNDYWKDNGWDYDKYPERIVTVFSDKFLEENIKKDYSKWDIIAQDFIKDMDVIIELIAKGGRTAIDNYVKQKFGV